VTFPSRQWILLLVPVFGLGVWLLVRTIRSLLHTTRGSVVAALPAIREQTFLLGEHGRFTLMVEGRLFTSDFAHAEFALKDSAGMPVPLSTLLIRTNVNSMGRARLGLREFETTAPGSYTLTVTGLPSDQDADNRLIVSRPIGGAIVLHVLGIVVSGIFVIASLVGSILLLVGRRGATP
jgi:hypothetical protein